MQPSEPRLTFISPLAEYCAGLYAEKRALGYHYRSAGYLLQELDRFFLEQHAEPHALPKALVQCWTTKRAHERPRNHQFRVVGIRQLALFMVRQGVVAYVPPPLHLVAASQQFIPYIFTQTEMQRLLQAADQVRTCKGSPPGRAMMIAAAFRVLYGCGLRASEVCRLHVQEVDLDAGVLTIRQTKFDKDRLVPMAPTLTTHLRAYAQCRLGTATPTGYFFPAPDHGPLCRAVLYAAFRKLLWACGISHGGTGHGPRLHDLRHTFAVHCLQRWVREGRDLTTALPVLSTYLGHNSLYGTQRYLRLTAELYPDITAAVEAHFGTVIPERSDR